MLKLIPLIQDKPPTQKAWTCPWAVTSPLPVMRWALWREHYQNRWYLHLTEFLPPYNTPACSWRCGYYRSAAWSLHTDSHKSALAGSPEERYELHVSSIQFIIQQRKLSIHILTGKYYQMVKIQHSFWHIYLVIHKCLTLSWFKFLKGVFCIYALGNN